MFGQVKKRSDDSSSIKMNLEKTKNPNSFTFSYLGIKNMLTVVETDYDNYAVVYTCTDMFFSKMYNVVILSRKDSLSEDKLKELMTMIKNKLGEKNMKVINQLGCALNNNTGHH